MPNVYQLWAPQTPGGLQRVQASNGTAFTVSRTSEIQFMKTVEGAEELAALLKAQKNLRHC